MESILAVHRGGVRRDRFELEGIATPAATPTWTPVPHHELVGSLVEEFRDRGIEVVREQYATAGRGDTRLFGVMDLRVPGIDDRGDGVGTAIGLRAGNDKSMALQVIAAARVFVCDNMAFSGSDGAVVLKRKHTSGLRLSDLLPDAIDTYLEKAGAWRLDIERMKDYALTDGRAKRIVYDAFTRRDPVLPVRWLRDVHTLYFDDDIQREKFADRSLWSLNNAFTEAVKRLSPQGEQRQGVAIGRYFGRVLHAGSGQAVIPALPAPAPVDIV